MIMEPVTIVLKNGESAYLCSPKEDNAQEVIAFLKKTNSQTDNMSRYPEEVDDDIEAERQFLARMLADGRSVQIAAFVDGRLAGLAGVNPIGKNIKNYHRAELGICVLQEFWGLGVGSALTLNCIKYAQKLRFEQLELEVVSSNERAKHLYEKCGFVKTGVLPHAQRLKDGRYQDYDFMVKMI